jgi:hypothetical protein
MNFKPTLAKMIMSIIVGLFMGLKIGFEDYSLLATYGNHFDMIGFLFVGIITFLIIYLIWSLIRRKN